MAGFASLQNSPLFNRMRQEAEQSVSQRIYSALTTRPFDILGKHKLVTAGGIGSMTNFTNNFAFSFQEATGNICIGGVATMHENHITVPVITTPMRAPNDPSRQTRTHRFAGG